MIQVSIRRSIGPLAFVATGLGVGVLPASSQPGTLDLSFAGDGKVVTPFSTDSDELRGLTLQLDGKIVAAGGAQFDGIALSRYHPDGSLDTSFGTDGKVLSGFGSAYGVGVQSGGRVVVAAQLGGDFSVVGYTTGGSLDPTFGTAGVGSVNFFGGADNASAMAIQPDDKIVVAGSISGATGWDFGVARFNADGSVDPTFGDGGKVNTNFIVQEDANPSYDWGYAVALQDDGKIVVAGQMAISIQEEGEEYPTLIVDFALARYDANGTLDATFGDGGLVTTDILGDLDVALAVVVQPNGKIVAAGSARTGGVNRFALARYRTDGVLDDTFGNGGIVATDLSGFSESADALVLQPDGKIVAVGHGSQDFAVARYERDGRLDPTFDGDGYRTIDFASDTDNANAALLQPDGKLVVGGYASVTSNDEDFALARLNMEPGPPPTSVVGWQPNAAYALTAFPNPSRGRVTLLLRMGVLPTVLRARILDVAGRQVRSWEPPLGVAAPATDQVVARWFWDRLGGGRSMTSGVYFAEVEIDGSVASHKILVSR